MKVEERSKESLFSKEWLLPTEFAQMLGITRANVSIFMSNDRYETKFIGHRVYIANNAANRELHTIANNRKTK